jgi:hypothetical protein
VRRDVQPSTVSLRSPEDVGIGRFEQLPGVLRW